MVCGLTVKTVDGSMAYH